MTFHTKGRSKPTPFLNLRTCLLWLGALGIVAAGWAGGTGTTELLSIQGEGATRAQGDWVSDSTGIGTYYSFYIEVPPAATRLVVQIYDADIGIGGGTEETANRDEIRGGGTTATYSLRNPGGTAQTVNFTSGTSTLPSGADGAWLTLFDSASGGTLATPAFEDEENDSESTNVTSITVDIPDSTNCSAGDLLLAAVATDEETTIGTPTGWTLIDRGTAFDGGFTGASSLGVFYNTATVGNLGSTETFSWTGSEEAAGAILCYSDVDTASPINVSAMEVDGFSNTPTSPAATTTVANTRVVRIYAADDDDLDGTPHPTGHTGRLNIESGTGDGTVSLGVADTSQASAGSTGTAAFDLDGTGNEQWVAMTIALQGTVSGAPAPTSGHWELRVDQSGSTGNDINAIGIRAHDGNSGSGGVELNVYAESFMTYGTNNAGGSSDSRSYTHHPYVVSGCDLEAYNFDWDSNQTGSQGSMDFDTRAATSLTTVADASMSTNDAWTSPAVTGWTDEDDATEYGIWTMDAVITGWPGNGNYGQILLSDENGIGGGNPNAQPEGNSFDIYVATDADAAPVKPYLEQQVRYQGTGPNPPNTNDTTRMTITVRFVNPTAHDVTFSNSNLVTANVPGGTVLYAGGDQVTQGTVTAEPSIGGSGDITWNPGTVDAGDTVILSYNVDVTPTSNGQVIDVTGDPSADGTTATYVDETCTDASPACSGAQLTRATPTLGPLCQLQVEEDALTYVKIDRFETYRDRDGLVLEWVSASEAGTMRYELWRAQGEEWVPVPGGRVPALFGAPQGGIYRVIDPDGDAGDRYLVVEHDRRGETSTHGPFVARAERTLEPPMLATVSSEARVPAERDLRLRATSAAANGVEADAPRRPRNTWTPDRGGNGGGGTGRDRAPAATDLLIRDTGLYYLDAPNIAGALGLSTTTIEQRIGNGTLRLENRGQAVAWTAGAGNGGLYFYGEAIDSLYTLDNVYRLSSGLGVQMATAAVNSAAPTPGNSYAARDRYEEDNLAALVLGLDPESDYWFWAALTAGDAGFDTWNASLPASALASGDAELTVHLLGSAPTGPGGDHEVDLFLGGNYLTTASWSGAEHTVNVAIDTGDLSAGDNAVAVQALQPGGSASFVFVDSAELTYERHYTALGDELTFAADGNSVVTLGGFTGPPILLEISDPQHPTLITGAGTSFQPGATDASYFAAGATAVREPLAIQPVSNRDLLAEPAEMILLVPADIEHSVDDLMGHRQNQGMSVLRVTLDQVMDQFSDGIFDPNAIRDFLMAAEVAWGSAPDYLTLVGTGNYDYRDLYGLGGQLMPPLFAATENGLYAADDLYGDLDGDGLSEVAVGRIPASGYADMWAYSQKVIAYETVEASSDVLLVSGDQRSGEAIDFGAENAEVAGLLAERATTTQLDLDTLDRDLLRQEMFSEMASGPAFVNYFGHGAADVWADDQILSLDDLGDLTGPPSVYTGLTCLMNRFEVVGFDSLGAGLLFADGGAVASWSPTAPESHSLTRDLGTEFYRRLASHDWSLAGPRIGDLIFAIKASYSGSSAGLPTFLLLGDPALEIRFAPLPGDPPNPDPGVE